MDFDGAVREGRRCAQCAVLSGAYFTLYVYRSARQMPRAGTGMRIFGRISPNTRSDKARDRVYRPNNRERDAYARQPPQPDRRGDARHATRRGRTVGAAVGRFALGLSEFERHEGGREVDEQRAAGGARDGGERVQGHVGGGEGLRLGL